MSMPDFKDVVKRKECGILMTMNSFSSLDDRLTSIFSFFQKLGKIPSQKEVGDFLGEEISKEKYELFCKKYQNILSKDFSLWTECYIAKGKKWASLFRFLPFVRGVAICNSLAMGIGEQKSDIDLYIITEEKHLWTARLFVTIFSHLFGVRRHGKKIAGRLCLSFFVTTKSLSCSDIALKPRDPYLAFWVSSLVPVFGKKVFQKIAEENRDFARENAGIALRFEKTVWGNNLPISSVQVRRSFLKNPEKKSSYFQDFLEILFFWTEGIIQRIWKPKTLGAYEKLEDKSGTVISENILKFHNSDKREDFVGNMPLS